MHEIKKPTGYWHSSNAARMKSKHLGRYVCIEMGHREEVHRH